MSSGLACALARSASTSWSLAKCTASALRSESAFPACLFDGSGLALPAARATDSSCRARPAESHGTVPAPLCAFWPVCLSEIRWFASSSSSASTTSTFVSCWTLRGTDSRAWAASMTKWNASRTGVASPSSSRMTSAYPRNGSRIATCTVSRKVADRSLNQLASRVPERPRTRSSRRSRTAQAPLPPRSARTLYRWCLFVGHRSPRLSVAGGGDRDVSVGVEVSGGDLADHVHAPPRARPTPRPRVLPPCRRRRPGRHHGTHGTCPDHDHPEVRAHPAGRRRHGAGGVPIHPKSVHAMNRLTALVGEGSS